MSIQPEINQRDLRTRSKDIMDAVEQGQTFTVLRDGHRVAELTPIRHPRRFVSRATFAVGSRSAPGFDVERFRQDQEAAVEQEAGDPYER
jgi:antitoxin (DNA-binding transcriptional repressor) of toxin-antitoxin stability system